MKFSKSFEKEIVDCDFNGKLKMSCLFSYFQETANAHSTLMKINNPCLGEGFSWVLNRQYVECIDLNVDETSTITTYAKESNGIECLRYYLMESCGKVVAKAVSGWAVIDVKLRRLLKASDLCGYNEMCEKEDLLDNVKKARVVSGDFKLVYSHVVMITDLDIIKHMNNTRYVDLAINALTIDEYKRDIKSFNISYLKEAKFGELINVLKLETTNNITIKGEKQNGEISFIAEISF